MTRPRRKQCYRFVSPGRATVGKWRASVGKALVDAAEHFKGWGAPVQTASSVTIKISCDVAVAVAMWPKLSEAGYKLEATR